MSETEDRSTVVRPHRGLERVTVNLTSRSVRALANLIGHTRTDAINRALQVYEFVRQVGENGGSVHVRRSRHADLERVTLF